MNSSLRNGALTRRSLLAALGSFVFASSPVFSTRADAMAFDTVNDRKIYSSEYFDVYVDGNVYYMIDYLGNKSTFTVVNDSHVEVAFSNGSVSVIEIDPTGDIWIDGQMVTETIYSRGAELKGLTGCVLMSKKKMTVAKAAEPSQIAGQIIGELLGGSNSIADLLWSMASAIFDYQVSKYANMWLIMEHWYCDSPKMITRKNFKLYRDKACTKLVKAWSVESPVGVS